MENEKNSRRPDMLADHDQVRELLQNSRILDSGTVHSLLKFEVHELPDSRIAKVYISFGWMMTAYVFDNLVHFKAYESELDDPHEYMDL